MEVDLSGDRRLLAALITGAFDDLRAVTPYIREAAVNGSFFGCSPDYVAICKKRLYSGIHAANWLLGKSPRKMKSNKLTLDLVCTHLDLEPEPIREKARQIIAKKQSQRETKAGGMILLEKTGGKLFLKLAG